MSDAVSGQPERGDRLRPGEWPERVVAICFYGRSGSVFLQSLLDSHPRLLSIPGNLYTYFDEFWEENNRLEREKLVASFCQYYAFMFDGRNRCKADSSGELDRMGVNEDQTVGVDPLVYLDLVFRFLDMGGKVTRKKLFQAAHLAYHAALGRAPIQNPIIVFQLHNPSGKRAEGLIEDFPDTIFLHMIREPLQTLNSFFKHTYVHEKYRPKFKTFAWVLSTILLGGTPANNEYKDRSRAVRLEDLKANPRSTMERVCQWIGIPWDDILLQSTINGKQFWFPTTEGKRLQGFEKDHLHQDNTKYFTWLDRFRLHVILAEKRRLWGYPTAPWASWNWVRYLVFFLLRFSFLTERLMWPYIDAETLDPSFVIRQILWIAWRDLFTKDRKEVTLLEFSPKPGFQQAWERICILICSGIDVTAEGKDLEDSEYQLRHALQRFPQSREIYTYLSILLTRQNRPKEAMQVVEEGLRHHKESSDLFLGRGDIHFQEKEFAKAEADYHLALKYSQSMNVEALVGLGDLCIRTNRQPEGLEFLRAAVRYDVTKVHAWAMLALGADQIQNHDLCHLGKRMLAALHPGHPAIDWLNKKKSS
ncbi:MAG: sulfotransferase [Magnetococcus sp. DMHC-1]